MQQLSSQLPAPVAEQLDAVIDGIRHDIVASHEDGDGKERPLAALLPLALELLSREFGSFVLFCQLGDRSLNRPITYLKVRTQRKYCRSLGWGDQTEYTEYIGLRADEPGRVAKMRTRNSDRDTDERAPLFDAGVTKADVLAFWRERPFDLDVPEWLGNCTGCFLKDEADLATALVEHQTDAAWWIAIEESYAPMRRHRSSYRQIVEELPARMEIRAALARGDVLIPVTSLSPRRRKLILAQELAPRAPFSCECDAAKADELDDELEAA